MHLKRLHKLHQGKTLISTTSVGNASERNSLPETRRYVMLSLDEMKIKEDIVYDKNTGEMIDFINLGNINNGIQHLQRDSTVDHPTVAMHSYML